MNMDSYTTAGNDITFYGATQTVPESATVTAGGLTFSGDTNQGIYQTNANSVIQIHGDVQVNGGNLEVAIRAGGKYSLHSFIRASGGLIPA